jgi:large subunit ribosomal protein L7/L12
MTTSEALIQLAPEKLKEVVTLPVLKKVIPLLEAGKLMELVNSLKEEFGISSDDLRGGAVITSGGEAPAAATATAEQTEFTVLLVGFKEGGKLGVIRIMKTITGASLGDAKKIVEDLSTAPYEVKVGISKAETEALKKQLEEAGGVVEVK